MSDLAEAWHVNNQMNFLLLDALSKEALAATYSPRTRTVAAQFAHMHNIRVYQLEKRGPDFLGKLEAFPRGAQPTKTKLKSALKASEKAVAGMLARADKTGKAKGWPSSPTTFLSYFVAHESHHRGLTLVALRAAGIKLPKEVTYGIWYWSKKYRP